MNGKNYEIPHYGAFILIRLVKYFLSIICETYSDTVFSNIFNNNYY